MLGLWCDGAVAGWLDESVGEWVGRGSRWGEVRGQLTGRMKPGWRGVTQERVEGGRGGGVSGCRCVMGGSEGGDWGEAGGGSERHVGVEGGRAARIGSS